MRSIPLRSIPLALTWEMLSHRRWSLIAAALGANSFPVILFAALRHEGPIQIQDPNMIVAHVILMQANMLIFGIAVLMAQGSPSRLYTLPLPTSTIVTWHLHPVMAIMFVESVLSTFLMNSVFHLSWPIWGPALFVAVTLSAIQAALYLTEKTAWIPVAMALVVGVLGMWFKSRYGAAIGMPNHYWQILTAGEVATMLAIAMLAYAVAVVAVARNRRGDPLWSLGIIAWLNSLFDTAREVGVPFRSPTKAQSWFEWRRKGWVMPTIVVFGMLFGFGIWTLFIRDPEALLGGFITGGGMLSVAGLLGGLMMGNSGPDDSHFDIGPFLATRPITTSDMARTTLRVAAQSVLLAWSIWAAAFLAIYLILLAIGAVRQPSILADLGWWYFPSTLLGPWIVVALGASVGMAGRSEFFVKLLSALFAMYIVSSLLARFTLSFETQLQIGRGAAITIGVAFLLATMWVFVLARSRRLIGWPTVYVAASVTGALTMMIVFAWFSHPSTSLYLLMFLVVLSALAVAPLAAAPLALAWNRTR